MVKAFDLGGGGAVDDEAENLVDAERIVDDLRLIVELAYDGHAGALFRMEEASMAAMAVFRHVLTVKIAGGRDLRDARNDTSDDIKLEKDVPKGVFAFLK